MIFYFLLSLFQIVGASNLQGPEINELNIDHYLFEYESGIGSPFEPRRCPPRFGLFLDFQEDGKLLVLDVSYKCNTITNYKKIFATTYQMSSMSHNRKSIVISKFPQNFDDIVYEAYVNSSVEFEISNVKLDTDVEFEIVDEIGGRDQIMILRSYGMTDSEETIDNRFIVTGKQISYYD